MDAYLDLLVKLVLGSYAFTASVAAAGAWAFLYLLKMITNHLNTRVTRIEDILGLREDEDGG